MGERIDQVIQLLVIGYHPNYGLAETLRGSTVQHVTHHAPCRVLVQVLTPKSNARPVVSGDRPENSRPEDEDATPPTHPGLKGPPSHSEPDYNSEMTDVQVPIS